MRVHNLEDLSNRLIDEWKSGSYTYAHNDEDCLLPGREMAEIFIKQAHDELAGEEEAEIMWHAEMVEEYVDEMCSKWRSYD